MYFLFSDTTINMLGQYIELGDIHGAIDIYNDPNIKDITLSQLQAQPGHSI